MNKCLVASLLLGLGLGLYAEVPRMVRCTQRPKMDGQLTDACWEKALVFSSFTRNNGTKWEAPLSARLLYDGQNLYIGMRSEFAAGKTGVSHEAGVFSGDAFEVMIDPNHSKDRYVHIAVNPQGKVYTGRRGQGGIVADHQWRCDVQAVPYIGKDYWSAEIRVPWYALEMDAEGAEWGFNFICDSFGPDAYISALPKGQFHSAGDFLTVAPLELDLRKYAWKCSLNQVTTPKMNQKGGFSFDAQVSVKNCSQGERKAVVVLNAKGQGGNFAIAEQEVAFKTDEERTLTFTGLPIRTGGALEFSVQVKDYEDMAILQKRVFNRTMDVTPLRLEILRPCYRNAIFESQKLQNIEYKIVSELNDKKQVFTVSLLDEGGKERVKRECLGGTVERIPVAGLPYGRLSLQVKARLADGKELSVSECLRKLPYQPGEVWRDEKGFWHRGENRFWPICEWGDLTTVGINASFYETKDKLLCDAVHAWGYPERKSIRSNGPLSEGDKEILRRETGKRKGNPNLLLWFLVDEPDCVGFSPKKMKEVCQVIRDEDPYHPILYDTYGSGVEFYGTGEINGLHPYPRIHKALPRFGFGRCAQVLLDNHNYKGDDAPSIFYFSPGYNNGDCGSVDTRMTSFDEMRTENLMGITMGGKGSMFYVWTGVHYPELYIGNTEFIQELHVLEKVLLADDIRDAKMAAAPGTIRYLVKQVDGEYWIFACQLAKEECTASFTIPQLGNRKLYAFREGRSVSVSGGRFQDRFSNYDARIYTTDSRDFGLKTLAQVNDAIEQVYSQRRKAGNWAWQRCEGDVLEVKASSNQFGTSRNPSNCLWHVTDGVTEGEPAKRGHGGPGYLAWRAKTKGGTPDWIELAFRQQVKAGRAVVYAANGSLRDMEFQVWQEGGWKTVGKVDGVTGDRHEFVFPSVASQRFRLYITKSNGAESIVHEIELYEK